MLHRLSDCFRPCPTALLDIHEDKAHNTAFKISKAQLCILNPTYADDVVLVIPNSRLNQIFIDAFTLALALSKTFNAKPSKCRSLDFKRFVLRN